MQLWKRSPERLRNSFRSKIVHPTIYIGLRKLLDFAKNEAAERLRHLISNGILPLGIGEIARVNKFGFEGFRSSIFTVTRRALFSKNVFNGSLRFDLAVFLSDVSRAVERKYNRDRREDQRN